MKYASTPCIFGMMRSSRTRSGTSSRARRSDSSPSTAARTVNPCWRSRASAALRRKRSASQSRMRRLVSAIGASERLLDERAELLEREVRFHQVAHDAERGRLGDVLLARGVREDHDAQI